jgi:tRNA-dihydrouridine synthase
MAGVSDKIFRQLCKERGADVLVTEFVSAEGVFRRNERTREYLTSMNASARSACSYLAVTPSTWPEAARHVIDWVRPDFIDLNFGCPVNKVGREERRLRLAEGLPGTSRRRHCGRCAPSRLCP